MATLPGCGSCGAWDAGGGETCAICRAVLLVDVVLESQVVAPRLVFEVAKDLAARVPGLPSFGELRNTLGRPGSTIAALPRATGMAALQVLLAHKLNASVRPHAPMVQTPDRKRRWPAFVAAGAFGLVAFGLAYWTGKGGALPEWPLRAEAPVAAPKVDVAVPLTTQEIGKRALPAVVQLRCGGKTGAGFFIDETTVVTNAHVTCEQNEIDVRLHDGRKLLGTVTTRETFLDIAEVFVAGASVTPLPLGSAVNLEPGQRLVFIGSPAGLGFTLHDASASFVGRPMLGVAYVQMQGAINPGNSGGPVLDAQGRVVGIVTLKMMNVEGIGLALPIEYARPPKDPEGKASWEKILATVKANDQEEMAAIELPYDQPLLAGVDLSRGAPIAIVVERWSDAPHGTVESFALRRAGTRCDLKATFTTWVALESVEEEKRNRELRWLLKNAPDVRELYVGLARLEGDCVQAVHGKQGELALVRGNVEYGKVDLGQQRMPPAPRQYQGPGTQLVGRRTETDGAGLNEGSWRRRFAEARTRIERIDREAQSAKDAIEHSGANVVGEGVPTLGYGRNLEKLQAIIDTAEERKRQAEEALADLEREAMQDEVPLEWRN